MIVQLSRHRFLTKIDANVTEASEPLPFAFAPVVLGAALYTGGYVLREEHHTSFSRQPFLPAYGQGATDLRQASPGSSVLPGLPGKISQKIDRRNRENAPAGLGTFCGVCFQ